MVKINVQDIQRIGEEHAEAIISPYVDEGLNPKRRSKRMKETYSEEAYDTEEDDDTTSEEPLLDEETYMGFTPSRKQSTDSILTLESLDEQADNTPAPITGLFTEENIRVKTDLSPKQVFMFSRLRFFTKKLGIEGLDDFMEEYMVLAVSKNRQSRKEFVDAHKAEQLSKQQGMQGLLEGFGGMK